VSWWCEGYHRTWFYPELPWGAPPNWRDKAGHGRTFLNCWEIWTFLCCIYVAGMVPWVLGFSREADIALGDAIEEQCMITNLLTGPPDYTKIVFVLDLVVDTTFFIDIIITFHTAVWEISRQGTPHWVLIDDMSTIRNRYLRGFFVLDVVAIFPWHFLDCIDSVALDTGSMPYAIKLVRMMRLLKLLRLYRIRRMVEHLHRKFPKSKYLVTILELLMIMIMIAHWMAAAWFKVGYPDGWVAVEGLSGPDAEKWEQDDPNSFMFSLWITSLYWSITTVSVMTKMGQLCPFFYYFLFFFLALTWHVQTDDDDRIRRHHCRHLTGLTPLQSRPPLCVKRHIALCERPDTGHLGKLPT